MWEVVDHERKCVDICDTSFYSSCYSVAEVRVSLIHNHFHCLWLTLHIHTGSNWLIPTNVAMSWMTLLLLLREYRYRHDLGREDTRAPHLFISSTWNYWWCSADRMTRGHRLAHEVTRPLYSTLLAMETLSGRKLMEETQDIPGVKRWRFVRKLSRGCVSSCKENFNKRC